MPSFNGYDGWSCWGRRYNETGEDDDQGENSIWFAWGPSGALLGPYSSRAACVAALIADVEGEKKKAKARHLEAQRRELFDWRKNELRELEDLKRRQRMQAVSELRFFKVESVGEYSIWKAELGAERVWFLIGPNGPKEGFTASSLIEARVAAGDANLDQRQCGLPEPS